MKVTYLYKGALIVLLAVVAALVFAACQAKNVTMEAENQGEGGVEPDTAFIMTVKGAPPAEELRAEITAEPDIAYDLTESEPGVYRLKPLRPLDAGEEVVFAVRGQSFAFAAANTLLVISSMPADGGERVPLDTGVEFTFNTRGLALSSLERAFSISPRAEGCFEEGDGRFVFYPTEELRPDTNYIVTLALSLESESGATLKKEHVISFTTISELEQRLQSMFQLSGNGVSMTVLTSETPFVQAYIDPELLKDDGEGTLTAKLYAFDGWESYAAQLEKNLSQMQYHFSNTVIDTHGCAMVGEFDMKPFSAGGEQIYNYGRRVFQFPEPLEEGWYAVDFSLELEGKSVVRQMFLQVSDLSVFCMLSERNLLAWVNDAATGRPVESARISMSGGYKATGTTGADGTVRLADAVPPASGDPYRGGREGYLLTVTVGDRAFVDIDTFVYRQEEDILSHKYISYLFTDRPVYRTTDTVQVWGVVRPRDALTPAPEKVMLELSNELAKQEVALSPDGTFTAKLSFENALAESGPQITITLGDTQLSSRYITVLDYVKPVYTAETSTDQLVYLLGEDPNAGIGLEVTLFDGTPASSFNVQLDVWSDDVRPAAGKEQRTDGSGRLHSALEFTRSPDTWYPQSYTYVYSSLDAQSENFYVYGSIYAIHRDVMLRGLPEKGSGGTALSVTTNLVDISGVAHERDLWDYDALMGAALSQQVTAEVHKIYYTKEKTGTSYDFINRRSVDAYQYHRHDDVVDTRTFSTVGGSYALETLPKSDNESCYYVALRTDDSRGRPVRSTVYLGAEYGRDYDNRTHHYALTKLMDADSAPSMNGGEDVYYDMSDNGFTDDERVTFTLTDNGRPAGEAAGRILYGVVQDSFSLVGVSDKTETALSFSEDLVPNYILTGAYFDGKHVFALEDTYMYFDPSHRELEIELSTDKPSYRPADEMRVTAAVKNRHTGKPAAGAELVLSVVDEAIFAIAEQNADILGTLYKGIYYPRISRYTSYQQVELGGGAEKGGGGGDEPRVNFEDTSNFITAKTDAQGKAVMDCKLPDNITSWRLTSLALTAENHAGNTMTNVSATKEFFVTPIVNELLLDGDSCAVGLYGAGVKVADQDEVRYSVRVQGGGVDKTLEAVSALRGYGSVDFGTLPQGAYTVTVSGECKGYKDAVQLPFSVQASGVEVSVVKTFRLADGIAVQPLRYPVSILFYNEGAKTYNTVLQSVLRSSGGARSDMRIARKYTARLLEKQGGYWYNPEDLSENENDINGSMLLSLFPYGERDIELSVKARLAAPDLFSAGCLRNRSVGNSDWMTGAKSSIYLAQALAGDGVEQDLSALMKSDGSLDFVDKMYIAMAMAVTGDREGAQACYDELVTPHVAEITGFAGDKAVRVAYNDSRRSNDECTAAASMLATMLKAPEAEGLVRYLAEIGTGYELYLFEQIYYLTEMQPSGGAKASFSYVKDGKTETVTLDNDMKSITFNKEQLEKAQFKVLSGEVYADVYYAAAPDEAADESKRLVGLTKKIEPVGGGFAPGGLVKVTLTPDFTWLNAQVGDAVMVLDDYIPSGMRFERYQFEDYSRGWYLDSRQGQRLHFVLYGAAIAPGYLNSVTYYARISTPGDYVVESAYISSSSADTWGASERGTVHVE